MKRGFIGIIGKPNVGKSTFLNALLNKKISITSKKPQTTRNKVYGIYKDQNFEGVFVDTPGFHEANNKLDTFLNSEIKKSMKLCDVFLFFIDLSRDIDDEDLKLFNLIKSFDILERTLCVFTKYDLSSEKKSALKAKELFTKIGYEFSNHTCISNKVNVDYQIVKNKITDMLIEDKDISINPQDYELDDKFIISEIIREQVIYNTKQEIPYSTNVVVDKLGYEANKNMFNIYASIVVEKDSQKPILIGSKGSMIKLIGINSRKELLQIYNCKINLQLVIKVEKD
jgi:GTP-binding protein Era